MGGGMFTFIFGTLWIWAFSNIVSTFFWVVVQTGMPTAQIPLTVYHASCNQTFCSFKRCIPFETPSEWDSKTREVGSSQKCDKVWKTCLASFAVAANHAFKKEICWRTVSNNPFKTPGFFANNRLARTWMGMGYQLLCAAQFVSFRFQHWLNICLQKACLRQRSMIRWQMNLNKRGQKQMGQTDGECRGFCGHCKWV